MILYPSILKLHSYYTRLNHERRRGVVLQTSNDFMVSLKRPLGRKMPKGVLQCIMMPKK